MKNKTGQLQLRNLPFHQIISSVNIYSSNTHAQPSSIARGLMLGHTLLPHPFFTCAYELLHEKTCFLNMLFDIVQAYQHLGFF